MCVKINVLYVQCTLYTVQCTMHILHIYAQCAFRNKLFIYLKIVYLTSQDQRILRALVK